MNISEVKTPDHSFDKSSQELAQKLYAAAHPNNIPTLADVISIDRAKLQGYTDGNNRFGLSYTWSSSPEEGSATIYPPSNEVITISWRLSGGQIEVRVTDPTIHFFQRLGDNLRYMRVKIEGKCGNCEYKYGVEFTCPNF